MTEKDCITARFSWQAVKKGENPFPRQKLHLTKGRKSGKVTNNRTKHRYNDREKILPDVSESRRML
jgi:hypothetical protein